MSSLAKVIEWNNEKIVDYLSNDSIIRRSLKITSISVASWYLIRTLYNGFFGPLSNIPGPFITRFIDFPSLKYTSLGGTRYKFFKILHEKYGNVVRLNPTTISVCDKDMVNQILVTDDLPKAPIYDIFAGRGGKNLFSTRDNVFHGHRRRIISPAFSIKYLNSLEPYMTSMTEIFIEKINKEIEKTKDTDLGYGVVDIWSLYRCLALDVIGETAFGQSFDMIENNSHFIPPAITEEIKAAAINTMIPSYIKFFMKGMSTLDPCIDTFLRKIIYDRMSAQGGEKRNDILQILLDSQVAVHSEDRLTADAIISETLVFLVAGSETTSNTLGFAIYSLLSHPEQLQKLYKEIDEVPSEGGPFKHEQLKNLPYLNAVINETLRVFSVLPSGLQRMTVKKTILGERYVLPEGITVISNIYAILRNSDYWDEPDEFLPERWITGETKLRPADNDAFPPFSLGSRNCIGKNFALQEMRIALASLLKNFELVPIEKELQEAQDQRQYITLSVRKNSLKVLIKPRSQQN